MPVLPIEGQLEKRQSSYGNGVGNTCSGAGYYYDSYGNCSYSSWSSYGRWILLAVIIVGAFLLFLIFS